jgi:replication-associated recombination protein RarA
MPSLFEKYRPKEWKEVVGHARMKQRLKKMTRDDDVSGKAFMFYGSSGIGKSVCAELLAANVCDPDNIQVYDASKITTAVLDNLDNRSGQLLLGTKHGRAVIINECHKLDSRCIGRLLNMLDPVPRNVVYIFTTQAHKQKGLFDDDDSSALESRCTVFHLEHKKYAKLFAKRTMDIAREEELDDGQELVEYVQLALDCECNLRKMISMIDAGEFLPEELVEVLENRATAIPEV